jgi:hypothetical protein
MEDRLRPARGPHGESREGLDAGVRHAAALEEFPVGSEQACVHPTVLGASVDRIGVTVDELLNWM